MNFLTSTLVDYDELAVLLKLYYPQLSYDILKAVHDQVFIAYFLPPCYADQAYIFIKTQGSNLIKIIPTDETIPKRQLSQYIHKKAHLFSSRVNQVTKRFKKTQTQLRKQQKDKFFKMRQVPGTLKKFKTSIAVVFHLDQGVVTKIENQAQTWPELVPRRLVCKQPLKDFDTSWYWNNLGPGPVATLRTYPLRQETYAQKLQELFPDVFEIIVEYLCGF